MFSQRKFRMMSNYGLVPDHLANPPPEFDITLVSDPNIPMVGVGEGSTVPFTRELFNCFGFSDSESSHEIKCTPKFSIKYENFNPKGTSFHHSFDGGVHGLHFNTKLLSSWALKKLECNVVEAHVDDIEEFARDYDFVFDCRGFPSSYEDYTELNYIPVNSVILFKSGPKSFRYTRSIAHENGWCFVIPLLDETSYGYLYNDEITTEEEAIDGFSKLLFREKVWVPEFPDFKTLKFKNYYHENVFSGNIFKMGFRASFVEPMESTANDLLIRFINKAYGVMAGQMQAEEYNGLLENHVLNVEKFIMWHYLAGSTFDTPFWHYALLKAKDCLYGVERLKNNKGKPLLRDRDFMEALSASEKWEQGVSEQVCYTLWGSHSLYRTGKGLGFF
jgi:hypothetical protein